MTGDETIPSAVELWTRLQEQQARANEQARAIADLSTELERQRVAKLSHASRLAEIEGGHNPTEKKLSRAGLFKAAAAGAAGLAAGVALGGPEEAAASGTMSYGARNDAFSVTGLTANNPNGGT